MSDEKPEILSARQRQLSGLKPWLKGVSGNPSGRPKGSVGLARRIQEKTNNGEDLLEWLYAIASGATGAEDKDRITAIKYLMDRGYGRTPIIVEHADTEETVKPVIDYSLYTREQLERLRELRELLGIGIVRSDPKLP